VLFDCQRCGAKQKIALPTDDSNEILCPTCQAKQSRRGYEVLRIKAELAAARQRAEAAARDAGPPSEPASEKGWVDRNPAALYALVFVGILAFGVAGLFGVGTFVSKGGPIVNLAFITGGAALAAFGVHAIRSPTSLSIAGSRGYDAFGQQQYGPSRPATREQGTMAGAVLLVVGAACVILGVFVGAF
jgi:hypothetical protein